MQALEKHDVMTVEPGQRNSASWIDEGDKYAVIGLSVKLDAPVPLQEMTPQHWAFADAQFDVPAHWREWLGSHGHSRKWWRSRWYASHLHPCSCSSVYRIGCQRDPNFVARSLKALAR